MKLTDKRFWNGEKTVYYPSFKHALTDSLLWSILGIEVICLLLSVVCLTIYFINGDNLSWDDISYFLFSCVRYSVTQTVCIYTRIGINKNAP